MPSRAIITTIDSLLAILKSYCKEEDLPADAVALKLFVNPQERRKLGLLVESKEFKDQKPVEVKFAMKRYV